MNYFKIIISVLALGFLAGCSPPQQPGIYDPIDDRDDDYYDRRARDDKGRDDALRRAKKFRSGSPCEEENERNHECKRQCKDMYNREFRSECEGYSVVQVEYLYEIHKLLKDPDEDELADIDTNDFMLYMRISIQALESLINGKGKINGKRAKNKWTRTEAKEFLSWLMNSPESLELFQRQDSEYDTLEAVLKRVTTYQTTNTDGGAFTAWENNLYKPFVTKIGKDKDSHLMAVAINALDNSEDSVEWFMEYISERVNSCDDLAENKIGDCFEIYCKIGKKISEGDMEAMLEFDSFVSFIDLVIENKANSNVSGLIKTLGPDIEEVADLNDDWVEQLCNSSALDD